MKLPSRKVGSSIAVVAACVIGATGVATASSVMFGDDGTLYACAQQSDGQLRLVASADACRPSEEPVHWNVHGPQGPPGPPGPPGAGVETLDALEGKPCRIDERSGDVAFTRFVPPLGGFALVGIYCLTTDPFEPNDTRAAAADVTGEIAPNGLLSLIGTTIHPAGDEDWFVVRNATFKRINVSLGLRIDVYRDGELVADDLEAPAIVDEGTSPHDWELQIRSTGGSAPIIVQMSPF